jgi:hypothetical protein
MARFIIDLPPFSLIAYEGDHTLHRRARHPTFARPRNGRLIPAKGPMAPGWTVPRPEALRAWLNGGRHLRAHRRRHRNRRQIRRRGNRPHQKAVEAIHAGPGPAIQDTSSWRRHAAATDSALSATRGSASGPTACSIPTGASASRRWATIRRAWEVTRGVPVLGLLEPAYRWHMKATSTPSPAASAARRGRG